MSQIVYLNGDYLPKAQATVSVFDRGFLFGDGIYEVAPLYAGKLFHPEYHYARLQRSLAEIDVTLDFSFDDYQQLCHGLYEKNDGEHQSIYLQITRGTYETRTHYFPEQHPNATIFAFSQPLTIPHLAHLQKGIQVTTHQDERWQRCNIKSISLLANVLARQISQKAGKDEVILYRDNIVTEAAHSNVFIIKDGCLMTHPADQFILGGITRQVTLELAKQLNIPCKEEAFSLDVLLSADEVWLSSTTKMVRPVLSVDEHPINGGKPGPVWAAVAAHFIKTITTFCETPS